MIINGTIIQASQASPPSGQFNVRYQDIVITDQNGKEWVGRIGSKQGYQANTPISVTAEQKQGETGPYNYFRKYNPQYPVDQGRQPTPQSAPQAPSRPPQGNKDRLIVAQVVYKAMAALAATTAGMNWDEWLMGNQLVFKRHVDLIMQIGAGKTPEPPRHQTEPDAPEPEEFDEAMDKPY